MTQNNTSNIIQKIAGEHQTKNENTEAIIQLVVFELDKEEYAVKITELQEIIRIPDITPIPNSPNFISGIFNLRGKIIVVVDLEKRFGLVRDYEKVGDSHIIIMEINENNFGIIVDRVMEIINVSLKDIQPTPAIVSSKIHADYLRGVVVISGGNVIAKDTGNKSKKGKDDSRLIILLDLPKMMQEKELLSMGKTIQNATKK